MNALWAHEVPLVGPSPNHRRLVVRQPRALPCRGNTVQNLDILRTMRGSCIVAIKPGVRGRVITTGPLLGALSLAVVSLAGRLAAAAPVHALIMDDLFGAYGG